MAKAASTTRRNKVGPPSPFFWLGIRGFTKKLFSIYKFVGGISKRM